MTPAETPDASGDMWLTLHEAARAFDVSLATLHRRRKAGALESVGAFKDKGTWKIPRQGLARLGFTEVIPPATPGQTTIDEALKPHETVSQSVSPGISETPTETMYDTHATELEALRDRLTQTEIRAAVAEAEARERAEQISDLRRTVRMLEAPKTVATPPEQAAVSDPSANDREAVPPRERSRWQRFWNR